MQPLFHPLNYYSILLILLMLCALSGTVAKEPVVSKTSGHVFEKRLVAKVIKDTGRCPVTNDPLSLDDLIDVQVSNGHLQTVRSEGATSVPGLLTMLQNEWDGVVLELYQVKKALQETRQELSHALYQHDAATRVIARLMRERDEYRHKMETQVPVPAAPVEEAEQPVAKKAKRTGLDESAVDAMVATSKELSARRKKREISASVATVDDIAGFTCRGSFPVHTTRKGGILCLEYCNDERGVVVTGGADSTVHVVDGSSGESRVTMKGHTKKVHSVAFVGSTGNVLSGSADGTVRLWGAEGSCVSVMTQEGVDGDSKKAKGPEVVSVDVHPCSKYFFSACSDGSWSMYDIERQERLVRVGEATSGSVSSAALHPDGLIYCTGSDTSSITVWEARNQKSVASFDGHTGSISSISFSENGYYMASAASDGVKIWDLRKLKSIQSLNPFGDGIGATSVAFDTSGLFLGVGGPQVAVYGVKHAWSVVKAFEEVPKKGVHAVAWGTDAKELFVGASDHNLRIFS